MTFFWGEGVEQKIVFENVVKLYVMFKMILFLGLELTFFSGVYGTCIAQNKRFGEMRKGLLGISGMLIGAGEILGQCHMTKV